MKRCLSLLCLVFSLDAGAQEHEFPSCPEEFPVEAIKLSPLPKGWVGIAPNRLLLTSVDLMVGSPQPSAAIGKRRKTRYGYEVAFEAATSEPLEKWLGCRYGDLSLAQRLPEGTDRCTVSYTKRPAFNTYDIQVACHTIDGGKRR